jgi:nucleoside-diphosphate-sugar epimerase
VHRKDIVLVNGGAQKRCFTYIDDAIDALIKIIENKNNCASRRIFNIGNPSNNISIRELAEKIKSIAMNYPKYQDFAENTQIVCVSEEQFFGKSYQDTVNRVPSIKNAETYLEWAPKTDIDIALHNTLDFYLS